jgi:hypothetical protein
VRRTALAVIVVALLAPISCNDGNEAADRPAATSTTATTATTAPTGPTPAATTASSAPASGTAAFVLKPDGIGDLAFGAGEAEARAALTKALGPPTFDESLPAESCSTGATRRVSWGDLTVLLGPGPGGGLTMVGWTYGTSEPPPTPALTTAEGIGVGSTVAQLRAAYGDRVMVSEDTAAGVVRFSVQGSRYQLPLAGVVSGPGDTATVRALYGGSYCAA